jgi:outer membrane biosynthesis protein TonB
VALLVSAASAACLKAEAKTPGPGPALTTPDPPARVLIPVPPDSLLPPTPTPTPEPTPAGTPPRTTPRPTPTPTPTTTPLPVETPTPILQTASNMAALESQTKERLDRAEKDLARVKRETLPPDARDNYDSAARYIRLARQAITDKNFPYAKTCADKAAIIAGLLVK